MLYSCCFSFSNSDFTVLFNVKKDTVHNSYMFKYSIYWAAHVWHYFSFAQVTDDSFSVSTSAAMWRRNKLEYLLQSQYSVTNTNCLLCNRSWRTLQAPNCLILCPFTNVASIDVPIWVFSVWRKCQYVSTEIYRWCFSIKGYTSHCVTGTLNLKAIKIHISQM